MLGLPYPVYEKVLKPVEWVRNVTKVKANIQYILTAI